jgi:hypothetical protein
MGISLVFDEERKINSLQAKRKTDDLGLDGTAVVDNFVRLCNRFLMFRLQIL